MLYHLNERTLTIGNTRMDTITFGSGPKPLVMIQGLNTRPIKGAGPSLALLYRRFAREFTVYLFDRRADLPEAVTVRDLARDVALAMDSLGLKQACVLGVSQGGMMAQYLAMDRPDLVKKLVLAVTLSRSNETVETVIHRWTALTRAGRWKALVTDMAESMYSNGYLKRYRPLLPLLTHLQKPKDVPRFLTLAKACLTCDTHQDLDKIQCPVLVIGGALDQVVGGETSRELAEKLGCRLHLYPDLGHAAYEEAKDFNRLVYDFFMAL